MEFYFQYQKENIFAIEGKLLLCIDEACVRYNEYDGLLQCTSNYCISWPFSLDQAYKFAEYHKIIVTFNDGTRESNVFTKKGYQAKYEVQVEEDRLVVTETSSRAFFTPMLLMCFSLAALWTLFIEISVAQVYIQKIQIQKSFLWYVIFANLISLPVVWFALSQINTTSELSFLGIAESFALIFEAIFLFFAGRNLGITFRHAILLSTIMNLASFLPGWIILSLLISG